MKKFLIKVLLYAVALLVIVTVVAVYYFRKVPNQLLLVSNSPSYNLKAGFIQQHPEKLSEAGIVVVGSSLCLNNVSAKMLQDSLHLFTINLSSWGLRIGNYEQSPIWDMHKIFLCNIGVSDFEPPEIEARDNFSFSTSKVRELFNLATDFNTFMKTIEAGKNIMLIKGTGDYLSFDFDECGSVLFSDSAFKYDSVRWNKDDYAVYGVDSAKLAGYVRRLKKITTSHQGYVRIVVSFSPVRGVSYNQKRSDMVAYLGRMIRQSCPNVVFINLYDRRYPDSVYADNCHFNIIGANRYTKELVDSMRRRGAVGTKWNR
jgi:hypothetical protein